MRRKKYITNKPIDFGSGSGITGSNCITSEIAASYNVTTVVNTTNPRNNKEKKLGQKYKFWANPKTNFAAQNNFFALS